jgi:hypothetical protein
MANLFASPSSTILDFGFPIDCEIAFLSGNQKSQI